MKTSSIRVEGNIISPELFDKLDTTEVHGQTPADFGFDRSVKVKDEIARAWADAKDQWNIFKRRTEKLTESQSGVEETRKYWIIPLLENLGYKVEYQRAAEVVNGNTYNLSHRDSNLDLFPIHIMGVNDNLDRKRESGGPRMSPHALLQEYINVTEHLYGIVTNGIFLRILRDSGKLVRLSYLEFNLQRMLEDDLYAEFSIMYRLIHSSRMPKKQTDTEQSIFEQYHQDAIESGSRIREKLSAAVEQSIKIIANGFLSHQANEELRKEVIEGRLKADVYFLQLLRFIYRILFLLVIEERDIVYPEVTKDTPQEEKEKQQYFKNIYYKYYSVSRLRKLAEKIYFFDDKLDDLWISLNNTFKIFEEERFAKKLGVYPLGGDLFSSGSIGLLSESQLSNKTLLECIKDLSLFESPNNKDVIRVNYAALNVEEFGSVYEGLLEYTGKFLVLDSQVSFQFIESTARSSSGSHYTPEELVQPLIKHSLEYVIEEKLTPLSPPLKKGGKIDGGSERDAKAAALLSIKVCDVACGSGHILLSAARRIAIELARVRTGEDQPSPGPYRAALRDVINHCIYGVDKNRLAVELCKVALWLEAYNPGMPLSFLDHKIKCGDSIVGLARREELEKGIANEAFKKMPGDDLAVVKLLAKKNKEEEKTGQLTFQYDKKVIEDNVNKISTKFKEFDELPENTLDEVKKKAEQYDVMKNEDWWRLKEAADVQAAQFFLPKTEQNIKKLTTFAEYYSILNGNKAGFELKVSSAMAVAAEKKFFHWFLEFPEVLSTGGFDCIVGNPPFLGNRALSGAFGDSFLNYVKEEYTPAGSCDIVTYFFRRIYEILKPNGFQSLISTNTIAQGSAREGGLDVILGNGGEINFAIRSMRWPGVAAVEVALVTVHKGTWKRERTLGNKKVNFISSYLDDTNAIGDPYHLKQNENKSFQGSIVLGKGFVLEPEEAAKLIAKNPKNKDVLFPYLNGEDLNSNVDQSPSRWVINFFDWEEDYCRENYPDCFNIIEKLVKPERTRLDETGNFVLRKPLPQKWWIYGDKRPALYKALVGLERVLVINRHSKITIFNNIPVGIVYSDATVILIIPKRSEMIIINSSFHDSWSWKNGSTMGTGTLRYTPSDIFETFPFPQNLSKETEEVLEKLGEQYHEFRKQLMLNLQLGLTKTYNLFHDPECNSANIEKAKEIKEFKQAKLQIPIEQAIKDIETLRALHKQMDEAVLKAYGWSNTTSPPLKGGDTEGVDLAHNFYEVDYLPENDRIRYTISPEARKEILKRLLALNHKIHEEEVAAGLWDKKKGTKDKKTKSAPPVEDKGQEKLEL